MVSLLSKGLYWRLFLEDSIFKTFWQSSIGVYISLALVSTALLHDWRGSFLHTLDAILFRMIYHRVSIVVIVEHSYM
jgi:hypothetical protein